MVYDEGVAARLRQHLAVRTDVVEKRMFGGLTFMVAGHMCCGVTAGDYMFRVGPDRYQGALAEPQVRPCDFTGRPLKGMVMVALRPPLPPATLDRLMGWSLGFVGSLPPK